MNKQEIRFTNWHEALNALAAPVSEIEINDDGMLAPVITGKYGAAYKYLTEKLQKLDAVTEFLVNNDLYVKVDDSYIYLDGRTLWKAIIKKEKIKNV